MPSPVGACRGCRRSRRVHLLAHDPCVLAYLPASGEPVLLEELDGRTEQETTMSLAARGHLGDSLNAATAGLGDLVEGAFQRRPGDALAAMLLVYVEAGDPPVRPRRRVFVVFAPVLDIRQFRGAAVLAPPLCDAVVVEDQRRMRAAVPDPGLLGRAIVGPPLAALEVITDAPAPSEDAVVAFDKLGEGIPRGGVKRTDCVRHHRVLSKHG